MPRKVPAEPLPTGENICVFCGLKDDNELEYGKLHEYEGIVTHYYCLLLSSNMQQRGRDDEGILGFLSEDINKELRRGKRLACCYCKKSGATLGCCNLKCKRIFHFPCGLKSGSLHQFFGEFKSYCKSHRPVQKIDQRVSEEVKNRDSMICYICYDEVNPRDMFGTLWAPCCKKNAWFHRPCVQQLAMSAGYFFKCPLCNNKTEFQKAMLDHGIFIPSQDASWELVPNAFEELLYRHNRCDAHKCLCPKGREHVSTNAKWELTLCRTCGSQGIHMACGSLKWVKPIWDCSECTSILNKSLSNGNGDTMSIERSRRDDHSPGRDNGSLSDDESSDSDISVGGVPDMHLPITINSASSVESSPAKSPRSIDPLSNYDNNSATRLSRQSGSLAKSLSSTMKFSTDKSTKGCNDDELPPVPKKPRIADGIYVKESSTVESEDDDIMVISGPSRGERKFVTTNGAQSPMKSIQRFFNDFASSEGDRIQNTEKAEKNDLLSKLPPDTTCKPEVRITNRLSSETLRPPPVEIDLSEGEISVPESYETNQGSSTFGDSPELNIKISNVTSLAPGDFDLAPEMRNEPSNFVATTSIPDSEEPIILDEKFTRNNNVVNNTVHEQMKIVKFDGVENGIQQQGNSVVYGLTIPGTNHTVPFIVSPPENCKSKTPGIHPDPNNPLGIALCDCNSPRRSSVTDILNLNVFNGATKNCATNLTPKILPSSSDTRKIENSQRTDAIIHTVKKRVTKPVVESIDAKLWSVPLKSIVKGTMSKPQSSRKTDVKIDDSSFTKTNGSSVVPPIFAHENSNSASATLRTITPHESATVAQTIPLNEIVPTRFAFFPAESSSTSSTSSTKRRIQPKQKNTVSGVNAAPNTVWAKINGSYVPINPVSVPKSTETTPASSKSSTGESDPPMFQFVTTDEKDKNDFSNNCDGDAGSGPAVQPASLNSTNAGFRCARTTTSSCNGDVAACGVLERRNNNGQHEGRCSHQKDDPPECSLTSDGRYSFNRTGLISKTINLRDIKFTIGGPNIVKMTLYETYNVNIKVDTTNGCKYEKSNDKPDVSSFGKIHRSSRPSENKIMQKMNYCDSMNTAVSLTNERSCETIENHDDVSLSLATENNVAIPESTSSQAESHADSRSQDELKENRDPIPASTNLINATNVAERKSKTRSRSGVNDHSMRSLNEKESQVTITDRIEAGPNNKVIVNENAHRIVNSPKIYYNGFKETNEGRTIVASNDTDIVNAPVVFSPVNAEIAERHQINKKRRILVKDEHSSGACDSEKSTTMNNSINYDCSKTIVNPSIGGVTLATIAEQFESAKKRKSGNERNFAEPQHRGKLKIAHDTNNFYYAKTMQMNGSTNAAEVALLLEGSKKKQKSIKDSDSNETGEFSNLITTNDSRNLKSTKVNSLVNDVKAYKRQLSETNHACPKKKFHANDASHNSKNASNDKTLCCKVSIDLARIRQILSEKLNGEATFFERKKERFANKIQRENRLDSKLFVKKTSLLSRSRSFDCSREIDNSRRNKISVDELQRSTSHENVASCVNNVTKIEGNRTKNFKRKNPNFEEHDCVR